MIDESTVEACAQVGHEANRAYCRIIGDYSQAGWDSAPDWQKDSARAGARGILDGSVGSPEDSHASWLSHKESAGWVYGETKDPDAKTHPCMVPYGQLSADQRRKDALFVATVRAVAA